MTKKPGHNYLKKLLALYQAGKLTLPGPGLYRLEVQHDDSCQIFQGGVCNCDPDLVIVSPNWIKDDRHEGTAI